ncbi:MAG: hypothetical protein CMM62_00085 [Rhodospirillaceae bacterium]|nr:hypothetical protein [Rhodospirillaceae bacterium]MAX65169.1 hypothetical protein [Rhodospirillaceae bacterium]|tara:strand:+ start:109 stop:660 length:552 start_codon:yes stop_codon:yes gene_type:complete
MIEPQRPDPETIREAYFKEMSRIVDPLTQQAFQYVELGAAYAQIGLKWSYLLNGGALIALPAYLSSVSKDNAFLQVSPLSIKIAAIGYVVGLVLSGLCSLLAYLNYGAFKNECLATASLRAWEMNNTFYNEQTSEKDFKAGVDSAEKLVQSANRMKDKTYLTSVFSVCGAYIAFFMSSLILVW